jgi:hypothetical protein
MNYLFLRISGPVATAAGFCYILYMTKKTQYLVSGSAYTPVGDLRNVTSSLEPAVYEIKSEAFRGTFLQIRENVDTSVPVKIYGRIPGMLAKTFRTFERRDKSTGVLLSGERGMGKSMFARLAVSEALKRRIPVILLTGSCGVDDAVEIVNQITQPIVVVMDEFEKNFPMESDDDDDDEKKGKQQKFLSMLDGMGSSEKRLFIATVNKTSDLSKFFLNRPGRFFYHFEFNTLTHEEMREYLEGECNRKIVKKKTIDYAVACMGTYAVNYDGIAAIVEELNNGSTIEEALTDLNLDRKGDDAYVLSIRVNGAEYTSEKWCDLNSIREETGCSDYFYLNSGVKGSFGRIGKTDIPGHSLTICYDGTGLKLNKDGIAIIPRSSIRTIGLDDCFLKKGHNEVRKVSPDELGSVGDIVLNPIKSVPRALYLDV